MRCFKEGIVFAFILINLFGTYAKTGFGPGEQEWGYVTVREGAHMFWWLHFTTADVQNVTERPLVIWLQGGPGGSSTAVGNFEILGPWDTNLNERNYTWINLVNVLFIDNPVGTGFSYVDDYRYLTTTNRQIGEDFAKLLEGIFKVVPEFATVPTYIFGQSYGGKMAPDIAMVVHEKVTSGELQCNLKGIALGNSWASPMDSVWNWAPYLLDSGAIDTNGYKEIDDAARVTQKAFDNGNYYLSTLEWANTQYAVLRRTYNIDFYNILTKIVSYNNVDDFEAKVHVEHDSEINPVAKPQGSSADSNLMNGLVKPALNLTSTWGIQSNQVFQYLSVDFMKPATKTIEALLNTTDIKVAVYSGQLDLICCTSGTLAWVDKLQWVNKTQWDQAERPAFSVGTYYEGYVRKAGNFNFYWINRAGHSSPRDNPAGGRFVLLDFLGLIDQLSPEY